MARHAQARHVQVNLTLRGNQLGLSITDDGMGIGPTQGESQGFGILGMRERVASLKGSFQMQSEAGQGVCIRIELPYLLE